MEGLLSGKAAEELYVPIWTNFQDKVKTARWTSVHEIPAVWKGKLSTFPYVHIFCRVLHKHLVVVIVSGEWKASYGQKENTIVAECLFVLLSFFTVVWINPLKSETHV